MKYRILLALVSAAMAGSVTGAFAETITYTFTGTASGTDNLYDFSRTGLIADQAFEATLTYDLSAAKHEVDTEPFGTTEAYVGGSASGATSSFGTASFSIGGKTISFAGNFLGMVYNTNNFNSPSTQFMIYQRQYFGSGFVTDLKNIPTSNGSYALDQYASGNFEQNLPSSTDGSAPTYLTLTPTMLTVSTGTTVGTVPLPASAPLFGASLFALGTVGYGLKRRKAAAAA